MAIEVEMLKGGQSALEHVLTPILESLDVAIKDCAWLLQLIKSQDYEQAYGLIASLLDRVSYLEQVQIPILDQLEQAHSEEMLENLKDVLERINESLKKSEQAVQVPLSADNGDETGLEDPLFLCDRQLQPLVRATKETFYFWGRIDKHHELRKSYYEHEFAQHRQNTHVASGEHLPFQVTIIVVAYNKLSVTHRCIESILANTDFEKYNVELILFDHASTDGTLEYFKTVPHAKVIHFKRNMRVTTLQMLPQFCRSQYFVYVANDTVVTKDWLDVLLTCIKSDPNIAIACPATPNVHNRQSCVPTSNCDELIKIAKIHNYSNPRLWDERVQVHPVIGIFNLEVINQIGFWDPAIYTFMRTDCDFSCQARRAGFKQILCCDVYCYHAEHGSFSSVYVHLDEKAQELFLKKNGIHVDYLGMYYDVELIGGLNKWIEPYGSKEVHNLSEGLSAKDVNILAIDCGVGDSPMQLKNCLNLNGYRSKIYHLTSDQLVEIDSKPLVDEFVCVPEEDLIQAIHDQFASLKFDYVCIDNPQRLSKLSPEFLEAIASRMTEDGLLAFNLLNEQWIETIEQMKDFVTTKQPLEKWCSVSSKTLNQLIKILSENFVVKSVKSVESGMYPKDKLIDTIKLVYGAVSPSEYMPIFVRKYTLVCQKKNRR